MEIKKILIILTAAMSLILPMFVGFNNAVYSSGYDTAYKITYSVYAGDSYIDGWKSGYYVDGINEMIDMLPETFGVCGGIVLGSAQNLLPLIMVLPAIIVGVVIISVRERI
jgi:hypothetical protein